MKRMLAVVLLIGTMALAGACGDDDGDDDDSGAPGVPATGQSADSDTGGDQSGPPKSSAEGYSGATGSNPDASTGALDRKVIFSSTMELHVDDVASAFATVQRYAREAGGYVEQSSMSRSTDDEGPKSATLTLRVPADRNGDVIASLRTMPGATVNSEGSKSTEVTEEYTDLQSRLRNLERTEAQYLDLLARATSINDILTVSDRLNTVRGQIEQIQGRTRVLDDMVELATIDVRLEVVPARVQGDKDSGPSGFVETFQAAWEDALEVGRYALAASAVVLVAAIWLAVPVLVVLLAAWIARRAGRTQVTGE